MSIFNNYKQEIKENFTDLELLSKFIIQHDKTRQFIVFDNIKNYLKFFADNKDDRYYHEIIPVNKPCKFFLDIDYKYNIKNQDEYLAIYDKIQTYLTALFNNLILLFNEKFPYTISASDILIVCSNSDINKYLEEKKLNNETLFKFSYNFIIKKYLFINYITFQEFGKFYCEQVKQKLGNSNQFIVDESFFNKSNAEYIQNRIIFNKKQDDYRVKYPVINGKLITDEKHIKDYILQYCKKNQYLIGEKNNVAKINRSINEKPIDDETIRLILDETKSVWSEGFKFRDYTGSIINFTRFAPTYCNFCEEIHHNDNQLYMIVINGKVFEKCRHYYGDKKANLIYEFGFSDDDLLNLVKNDKPTKIPDEPKPPSEKKFNNGIIEEVFYEPFINHEIFEKSSIVLVKAEMKMGKTKALKQYFYNFSDLFDDMTVVIVSFRRTFTNENITKLKDFNFENYMDISSSTIDLDEHKKLIIQVESLNRINFKQIKKIDILILDEIESILSQFNSSYFKDFNFSLLIFQKMLEHSKKLIAMDANISNRTLEIIKYCNEKRNQEIYMYKNLWNPNKDYTYYILDKDKWITVVGRSIIKNNKIAIFTNSLKEAKTLKQYLQKYIKPEEIKIYHGKTKESVKKKDFSDVNSSWTKYRCIICTPTVSAGISFESEHFNHVFGYFTDASCNADICCQMLGRIRNVISKEIFICINDNKYRQNKLVENYETIEEALRFNRVDLINKYPDNNVDTINPNDIDIESGELLYRNNFEKKLIIENILYENNSKNNFRKIIIDTVIGKRNNLMSQSDIIKNLSIESTLINTFKSAYEEESTKYDDTTIRKIMNEENIDNNEKQEIKNKMRNNDDIKTKEYRQLEKHNMARRLNLNEDIVFDDKIELSKNKHYHIIKNYYNKNNKIVLFENNRKYFNDEDLLDYEFNIECKGFSSKSLIVNFHEKKKLLNKILDNITYNNKKLELKIIFISQKCNNYFNLDLIDIKNQVNIVSNMLILMQIININNRKPDKKLTMNDKNEIMIFLFTILKRLFDINFKFETNFVGTQCIYFVTSKIITYRYNDEYYYCNKIIKQEKNKYPIIVL